jgi:hypothetical protein
MHGAGSPQARRVVVQRLTHWNAKRKLAERIAGIAPGREVDVPPSGAVGADLNQRANAASVLTSPLPCRMF